MQDGLSILFYTRMNFEKEKTISIPCFVNEKEETTILNFYSESEAISIDSVDYEIDCRDLKVILILLAFMDLQVILKDGLVMIQF